MSHEYRKKGRNHAKVKAAEKVFAAEMELDEAMMGEATLQVEGMIERMSLPPSDEELVKSMNTKRLKTPFPTHSTRGVRKVYRWRQDMPKALLKLPEGEVRTKAIKAAAQAALILGQPAHIVATQYGLNYSDVAYWEQVLLTETSISRRDRLSDMLMVFIEQELKSLMSISIVTSNEQWILLQDADSLANFVAVKTDRLLAMLGAFGRAMRSKEEYVSRLETVGQDNA